jgi:hypothetical protein
MAFLPTCPLQCAAGEETPSRAVTSWAWLTYPLQDAMHSLSHAHSFLCIACQAPSVHPAQPQTMIDPRHSTHCLKRARCAVPPFGHRVQQARVAMKQPHQHCVPYHIIATKVASTSLVHWVLLFVSQQTILGQDLFAAHSRASYLPGITLASQASYEGVRGKRLASSCCTQEQSRKSFRLGVGKPSCASTPFGTAGPVHSKTSVLLSG